MKENKVLVKCDICSNDIIHNINTFEGKLQVIFTTEQTEGRSTSPYLGEEEIDLCEDCYKHLLSGNYIYAAGAMGYNKYFFKKRCVNCSSN
jgi:hypothetical protein